jgi:hypothetical protein
MEKISLAFLVLLFIYISSRFISIKNELSQIKKGYKIPKQMLDFPIHQSSQNDYLKSKLKIEEFLSAAVENKEFNLVLDQNDINNLFWKGLNIDRSNPGSYFYYSIESTCIIEKFIQWPSWFTLASVYTETSEISFDDSKQPPSSVFKDSVGVPSANYRKTEEEGRVLDLLSRNYPISYLSLFVCIFDYGYLRLSRYIPNTESTEYKRVMLAMRNIDLIKIENETLIIQI